MPARSHQPGVKAGDRVAIMCGNRPELLLTILGCGWLGAIAVPINTASRGAQLAHILGNCGARLMVVEGSFHRCCAFGERNHIALKRSGLSATARRSDLPHLKSRRSRRPANAFRPHPVEPGDTSRDPLHLRHHRAVEGRVLPACPVFLVGVLYRRASRRRRDGDVLMTTLPLFHTNALNSFFQALLNGATLVVEPRFSASGFIAGLIEQQATVTYRARRHGADPVGAAAEQRRPRP